MKQTNLIKIRIYFRNADNVNSGTLHSSIKIEVPQVNLTSTLDVPFSVKRYIQRTSMVHPPYIHYQFTLTSQQGEIVSIDEEKNSKRLFSNDQKVIFLSFLYDKKAVV